MWLHKQPRAKMAVDNKYYLIIIVLYWNRTQHLLDNTDQKHLSQCNYQNIVLINYKNPKFVLNFFFIVATLYVLNIDQGYY